MYFFCQKCFSGSAFAGEYNRYILAADFFQISVYFRNVFTVTAKSCFTAQLVLSDFYFIIVEEIIIYLCFFSNKIEIVFFVSDCIDCSISAQHRCIGGKH